MKKKLLVIVMMFVLAFSSFYAAGDKADLILGNVQYLVGALKKGQITEESFYQYFTNGQSTKCPAWIIEQEVLNQGYLLDYVDEFKAGGYISPDYTPPGSAATSTPSQPSEPAPQPTPQPETYTVTDCVDYQAWAIKNVNVRDGASTTHDIVDSLVTDDEVTVIAKAKNDVTGQYWYQIVTADGVEGFAHSSYITNINPFYEEPVIEETETEEVYTETKTHYTLIDPNAPKEEPTVEEPSTVEEPTTLEFIEDTSTTVETKADNSNNYIYWVIGISAVAIVGVIIGGVKFMKSDFVNKIDDEE